MNMYIFFVYRLSTLRFVSFAHVFIYSCVCVAGSICMFSNRVILRVCLTQSYVDQYTHLCNSPPCFKFINMKKEGAHARAREEDRKNQKENEDSDNEGTKQEVQRVMASMHHTHKHTHARHTAFISRQPFSSPAGTCFAPSTNSCVYIFVCVNVFKF